MPTWSNFKNKHDKGIMQIFCSYENMIYFQVVGTPCLYSLPWKSLISFSNDVHLKEKTLETIGKSYTSLWKVPSVKCLKVNFLIGNKACACQSCVMKTLYRVRTKQLRESNLKFIQAVIPWGCSVLSWYLLEISSLETEALNKFMLSFSSIALQR